MDSSGVANQMSGPSWPEALAPESFHGLAIDAAATFSVDFIVKGLRNSGDFEVEQQMAHTNQSVSGIRTVYVPCRPDQVFLSSRFIREIAQYGRDVSHLVPKPVAAELARVFPPSEAPS